MKPTRCDLHLHSAASHTQDEWYGKYFACPESYADPLAQYDLCKARGMTLVTLTDHDTVAGGLKLADKPDFFLSEEITTRFPENGCVMHVLAWNIDPDQHARIQERRNDIYVLTDYLQDNQIAYGLAHPLLSPNWKLDRDTFEKALLLFPTFEVVNGLTDARIEPDLGEILAGVDESVIQRLAAKHGCKPRGPRPHLKAETGGSDDHASRRGGTVYTEVDADNLSANEFLRQVLAGEARVVGHGADLNMMSACSHKTTSDFLRRRGGDAEPMTGGDPVSDLMDAVTGQRPTGIAAAFLAPLLSKATNRADFAERSHLTQGHTELSLDQHDAAMVEAVARTFDGNCGKALDAITTALMSLEVYRIFDSLRDLACAAAAAAPYLFSVDHFGKQYAQARALRRDWNASQLPAKTTTSGGVLRLAGTGGRCLDLVRAVRDRGPRVRLRRACSLLRRFGRTPRRAAVSSAVGGPNLSPAFLFSDSPLRPVSHQHD